MLEVKNINLEKYKNLEKYRIRGLNFNYGFRREREIDKYAFCNIKTGEIASNIITYVSMDVEKIYQTDV